jgi:hypothetical protein
MKMDNEFTKDQFGRNQFSAVMELSEKIEDLVEGKDFFICAQAIAVVIARGSRSALTKHRQEFSKDDFIGLFATRWITGGISTTTWMRCNNERHATRRVTRHV